jgi:hypothetical protein
MFLKDAAVAKLKALQRHLPKEMEEGRLYSAELNTVRHA